MTRRVVRHCAHWTFERLAGSRLAGGWSRRRSGERLRVLAYHDMTDPDAFELHMRHVQDHYTPVSGRLVAAAFHGTTLPPNAVWVTFDDAHPQVVEKAKPVLDRLGIPATLFVCPGMVDTDRAYWWTAVSMALQCGIHPQLDGRRWADTELVTHLKTKPDDERRAFIAELEAAVAKKTGRRPAAHQIRSDQLVEWVAAGYEIGNHTWDHPCLDRCTPEQQQEQILRADEWLRGISDEVMCFAYPNGNWSPEAEAVLTDLGYATAVEFDHRLADVHHPFHISRLRVSADAGLPRFASIVSGLHAQAFHMATRCRRATASRGGRYPSKSYRRPAMEMRQ